MEIIYLKASELKESEYNPREITEGEFDKLKKSLSEFGFVEPIVINKNNEIIGGHMRLKAGIAIGLTEFPCVIVDITGNRAKLLNLALNRISGRWDVQKLGELITGLTGGELDIKLSGFDEYELNYYNLGPDKGNDIKELWNSMPEFDGKKPFECFKSIMIHFENEKDVDDFANLINQNITDKTKYIWYPFKEKQKLRDYVIETKDDK